MYSNKLISILSSFNKEELGRVRKFILQYSKETSDVMQVFDYYYKNFKSEEEVAEIETVVEKYFNHLTKKVFLNHLSTLLSYVEQWLVLTQIENEKHSFDLTLVKAYNKRGLYHMADLTQHKILKNIDKEDHYSIENTKAKATLLNEQYYSNNPIKYEEGAKILTDLMQAYFKKIYSHLLVYESELINWGKIQKHSYEEELNVLRKIKEVLPKTELSLVLEELVSMVISDDTDIFLNMVSKVLAEKFEKGNLQTITTIYTVRKANELWAKKVPLPELKTIIQELYDFAMTHGVFTDHGMISPPSYRNLLMVLCLSQSYEQLMAFNDKWISKVNSKCPESTKAVCNAIICFYKERYKEIMDYTRYTEYDEINEKAFALHLHLIACFMNREQEYDLYVYTLSNFESFLLRAESKVSEKTFKSLRNSCSFMKQYDKTKNKVDLSQFDVLQFRLWMEKMNEKRN